MPEPRERYIARGYSAPESMHKDIARAASKIPDWNSSRLFRDAVRAWFKQRGIRLTEDEPPEKEAAS